MNQEQAPTMAQVEAMPWMFPTMIAKATVFSATAGRRRQYMSEGDARAYDDGWRAYPARQPVYLKSPFADGFFDAEAATDDCRKSSDTYEVDL